MRQRVHFVMEGDRIIGDLYLPAAAPRAAAVVVAGPMTSVKEQVTGTYACAMAVRGYVALAIDPRHFGESGGTPRQYENWRSKVAELRAALDFLEGHPAVDPQRIGLVGVCLGAGYAAWASVDEPRVRALAAVAGYYRDPADIRAKDPSGFDENVEAGRRARERFERTGDVQTIPAAALQGDAAMTMPDTFDYYATARAGVPNYTNQLAVMSRELFLPFDVQAAAPRLRAPVAMIHAEQALSPVWARRFFEAIPSPKTLEWLESKGQVDFYDDPSLVRASADHVAAHFAQHLDGERAG